MTLLWSNLNNSPVAESVNWVDKIQFGAAAAAKGYADWVGARGVGNIANACVTGVLGIIGMIGTVSASSKMQDIYRKQEAAYIDNAMQQARRLQLKGDIELRNLRYQHAISQGQDELAVAAGAHGNLSGSFLDKLVANRKYDDVDERTQSLGTLWSVTEAKRQGYINAMSTAGYAEMAALNARSNIFNTSINSITRAAKSLMDDTTAQRQIAAREDLIKYQNAAAIKYLDEYYYNPSKFNNSAAVTDSGDIYDKVPFANGDGTFNYSLVKIK